LTLEKCFFLSNFNLKRGVPKHAHEWGERGRKKLSCNGSSWTQFRNSVRSLQQKIQLENGVNAG